MGAAGVDQDLVHRSGPFPAVHADIFRPETQQQMGARDHAAQLRRLMRSINAQNNTALGIDPATGNALLDALDATTEEEWS